MSTKWNKLKLAGVFFFFCMIAAMGQSNRAKAADALNLNQSYTVKLDDNETRLYQFTVSTAGNIKIHLKNTDPVGTQRIGAQLYDSNNLELTQSRSGANIDLPIYSTGGGRTFYLKLWNDYYAWETSFQLTVEFQATTNWETEDNNSTGAADPITANKTWYGMINDNNDECDYFKFTLNANKKVNIKFGPAEVDGESHRWAVSLLDSKNNSVEIYNSDITKTYTTYLKKGTYYLKIENSSYAENITYAFSYSVSSLKIKTPKITSIKLKGYKHWFTGTYMKITAIKLKNSGECAGYSVKVSRKKSMKTKTVKDIDLEGTNSLKKISFDEELLILKKYYVQVRGYVKDAFGNGIYGKYSKVKCKKTKKSVYKKLKS